MSVLDDLGVHLEGLALVTVGTDLFKGRMPPTPSECFAITEYQGDPPLRNQTEGAARSGAVSAIRPRVQLLCRAETYPDGETRIVALASALDGIVNQTINGTWYVRVAALQSPFHLETDANDREVFAVNFAVTKNQ